MSNGYILILIAEIFSAFSAVLLFGWAFVCFVLVGCSSFGRLFRFREFNLKINDSDNDFVSVRYLQVNALGE